MKLNQIFALLLASICLCSTSFAMSGGNPDTGEMNTTTGWVAPKSKTFGVRSIHDSHGDLIVWVKNEQRQMLQLELLSQKGEEMAFHLFGKKPQTVAIRLDMANIPDGIYQLRVSSPTDVITKTVQLSTSSAPRREAKIAVAKN